MNTTNLKRKEQLGMSYGSAIHHLKKSIMFSMAQQLKQDNCFRCKEKIENINEFTIEHKINWLDVDSRLFWDLENIAFSHASCNYRSKRHRELSGHGTRSMYEKRKCRCAECKQWKSKRNYAQKERRLSNRGFN